MHGVHWFGQPYRSSNDQQNEEQQPALTSICYAIFDVLLVVLLESFFWAGHLSSLSKRPKTSHQPSEERRQVEIRTKDLACPFFFRENAILFRDARLEYCWLSWRVYWPKYQPSRFRQTSSFFSIYFFRQQAREKDEEEKNRKEIFLLSQLHASGELFSSEENREGVNSCRKSPSSLSTPVACLLWQKNELSTNKITFIVALQSIADRELDAVLRPSWFDERPDSLSLLSINRRRKSTASCIASGFNFSHGKLNARVSDISWRSALDCSDRVARENSHCQIEKKIATRTSWWRSSVATRIILAVHNWKHLE